MFSDDVQEIRADTTRSKRSMTIYHTQFNAVIHYKRCHYIHRVPEKQLLCFFGNNFGK